MITLKQWMETFNYRITESDTFGWNCYGDNAQSMSAWNGEHDGGWSGNIVFDRVNQTVYEVDVCDYTNKRAYRMIKTDFKRALENESKVKDCSFDEAWDDVKFVELETDEDWLKKAQSIVAGVEYDTRIEVPIELDNDTIAFAALEAHKRDITLNDYIQHILQNILESENAKRI